MTTFQNNHPKFIQFLNAAKGYAGQEGSVIEVTVKDPQGNEIASNIKVQQSDLEALNTILGMIGK